MISIDLYYVIVYVMFMSQMIQNATIFVQAADMFGNLGLAEFSTYFGAALSGLGLWFSWLAFRQAKDATMAAEQAREAVYKIDSVSEISKAISLLNEAQSHIRSNNYSVVPDRFVLANSHICAVRNGCPNLSGEQRDVLQNVSAQIYDIKSGVERELEGSRATFKKSKANDILSKQADILSDLFEKMKRD